MAKKKKSALAPRKKAPRIWLKVMLLAILAMLSAAILAFNLLPAEITASEGEMAGEDVFYSGPTTAYDSQLLTAVARTEAAAQVKQEYKLDDTVLADLLSRIKNDFDRLKSLRNNTVLDDEGRLAAVRKALPGVYTDESLLYVLEAGNSETVYQSLRKSVNAVYEQGVQEAELLTAREDIISLLTQVNLDEDGLAFLLAYFQSLALSANEHYDALATEAAMQEARDAVDIVQVTVPKGKKLLSRGSPITAEDIEALQALGMHFNSPSYTPYGGLLALVALLIVLLGFYLYYYQPKLFAQEKSVLLLTVIILLVLLLCRLISLIDFSSSDEASALIGYLLPVAAASMLVAVLLERNLAIFVTIILSVFVGIISQGQASYALVALGGGLTGILSTTRLNQRSQFVVASIYIALTNMLLIGGWGLLSNHSYPIIGMGMGIGLFNGLLSAILAMGILPFLESAFSVTTVVRLLELSNSNHPLLKRLMMEAPGTYNHSILVGNLAEAAAEAIGADTLLVRVASYYHDVGKLKRPYFFIENQGVNDNPHDKLQPSISVMIITSHVREGVGMLRQARFPEEIIALVEQHHGTGFLHLFYKKALEQALDSSTVHEVDFRYPYNKPQSREAALVLLADNTQAAVQSLKQVAKGQVEETVRNIIRKKMEDGQLQECPLTFQDMQLIEETFLRVLSGMNHSRLAYPEQAAKEAGGNLVAPISEFDTAELTARVSSAEGHADQGGKVNH
jgi:putative nucleotidyltransferase with HDIG domain